MNWARVCAIGASAVDGPVTVTHFAYRLFIGCTSFIALLVLLAYYLLPLPQPVREVLAILDIMNALILLGDFFVRLAVSRDRFRYFVMRGGWLDLLGSVPAHPLLRIPRILRSIRSWLGLVRTTSPEIRRAARQHLAESGLFGIATLIVVVTTGASIALAAIEPGHPGATINRGADAMWFVVTTIATVGYGDTYPVTSAGRVVGVFLMVAGVGAFSVLTSYVASAFISARRPTPVDAAEDGEERDKGTPVSHW